MILLIIFSITLYLNSHYFPVCAESLELDFCAAYKTQFALNCNSVFSDTGDNDFCSIYGVKCRGWRKFDRSNQITSQRPITVQQPNVQGFSSQSTQTTVSQRPKIQITSSTQQTKPQKSAPLQPATPQKSETEFNNSNSYCDLFGKDYYALCLHGKVPDFATTFCNGFKNACPGVPKPGSLITLPAAAKPISQTQPQNQVPNNSISSFPQDLALSRVKPNVNQSEPIPRALSIRPTPNKIPDAVPAFQQPVPLSSLPLTGNSNPQQPLVLPIPSTSNLNPIGASAPLNSSTARGNPTFQQAGVNPVQPSIQALGTTNSQKFDPLNPSLGSTSRGQFINSPFDDGFSGTPFNPFQGFRSGAAGQPFEVSGSSGQALDLAGLRALNQAGVSSVFGGRKRRKRLTENIYKYTQ